MNECNKITSSNLTTASTDVLTSLKQAYYAQLYRGHCMSHLEYIEYLSTEAPHFLISSELEEEIKQWLERLHDFKHLSYFLHDVVVQEIIFHSHKFIHLDNGTNLLPCPEHAFDEACEYEAGLMAMAIRHGVEWNLRVPFASFLTKICDQHFRATLLHYSCGPGNCSKLFLRRISHTRYPLESFCDSDKICNILKDCFVNKMNIVIAGKTGSGKTALLRTLLADSQSDHTIIIEDTHEILTEFSGQTHLLASESHDARQLLAYSLRMRPDRVVLGEIRSKEVVPLVLALNTGHRGLLSTLHSNSAQDAFKRLCTLFLLYSGIASNNLEATADLMAANIEILIYMQDKKIIEIIRINGNQGINPYYDTLYTRNKIS